MERGENVVGCGGSEQDPTRNRYTADREQQHAPHRIQTPPSHFRTIGGGAVLSHQRDALVRGVRTFVPIAARADAGGEPFLRQVMYCGVQKSVDGYGVASATNNMAH